MIRKTTEELKKEIDDYTRQFIITNPIEKIYEYSRMYVPFIFRCIRDLHFLVLWDFITMKYIFYVLKGENVEQLAEDKKLDLKFLKYKYRIEPIIIICYVDPRDDGFKYYCKYFINKIFRREMIKI